MTLKVPTVINLLCTAAADGDKLKGGGGDVFMLTDKQNCSFK